MLLQAAYVLLRWSALVLQRLDAVGAKKAVTKLVECQVRPQNGVCAWCYPPARSLAQWGMCLVLPACQQSGRVGGRRLVSSRQAVRQP